MATALPSSTTIFPADCRTSPHVGTIQVPNAAAEFSDDSYEVDDVFKLSDLYSRTTLTRHSDMTSGDETVRHTLSVRHRRTSYTRFGAWA